MPQVKEYFHDVDLKANQLFNSRLHNVTTSARISIGSSLGPSSRGYMVYDTDLSFPFFWNGVDWGEASGRHIPKWGEIIGDIIDQTDLTTYLSDNYYPLSDNPAGYLTTIPSLDEVLTVGNSAYSDITFYAASNLNMNSGSVTFAYDSLTSIGFLSSLTTGYTDIRNWFLPDASGIIPLTVNNIAPDDFGNITISAGGGTWGSITGDVVDQTDLVDYLGLNYYPFSTNPAGYLTSETDPVFNAWLATPPDISIFNNDSGYLNSIPTLQQVTDAGNTTNNDIQFTDSRVGILLNNGSKLKENSETVRATATIDYSMIAGFFPAVNTSIFANGYDPITSTVMYFNIVNQPYASLSDFLIAANAQLNSNPTGYTSVIDGNKLIIKAKPGFGAIFNGVSIYNTYNIDGNVNGFPSLSGSYSGGYSLGISQICSAGYELRWEAGSLYVMNNGGTLIREVRYTFGITPGVSDDDMRGFYVGSRWVLDDGDVYVCTDATTGNAVWELVNNITGVTSVTATSPLFSSGGLTPDITIQQANGSQDGYLSSGDWTTFNTKEPAIVAGTASQYWRGDKTWQTFPTIPTVGTWGALNYPTWTTGIPFVKMDAAGSFILDTNTYLTSAVTSVATTGLISGGTITNTGTISTSMNTGKLVGRGTTGVGVMEEITLGTGLSLSGTTLNASAGGARLIVPVTADITGGTASGTDYVYLVNQTSLVTVTLPPASGNTNSYTIKRIGTGPVNIATTAGTIDGSASPITINVQNVSLTLVTNGTNWFII